MMSAPITPQPVITVVPLNPALVNKAGLPSVVEMPINPPIPPANGVDTVAFHTASHATQRTGINLKSALASILALVGLHSTPAITGAETVFHAKKPEMLTAMHQVFAQAEQFVPYTFQVIDGVKKETMNVSTVGAIQYSEPMFDFISIPYIEATEALKNADNVYLGDLHGSWNKLLAHLTAMEAVQMPAETAAEFVEIHKKMNELNIENVRVLIPNGGGAYHEYQAYAKEDEQKAVALLNRFKQALATVEVINDKRGIHLIGDLLGDRGQNDYFTLLLLEAFQAKIKSAVLSNHDWDALHAYRNQLEGKLPGLTPLNFKSPGRTTKPQVQSATLAFQLANANNSMDELLTLYKKHFKRLEFMHYDSDTKTLSMHQAFNPKRQGDIIANYSMALPGVTPTNNAATQQRIHEQVNSTDPAEYAKAVATINDGFKRTMAKKYLNPSKVQMHTDFDTFLKDMWYGREDSRRGLKTSLEQDKAFPFYNQYAVNTVVVGHTGSGFDEAVIHSTLDGEPVFISTDNNAAKTASSAKRNNSISRVFVHPKDKPNPQEESTQLITG